MGETDDGLAGVGCGLPSRRIALKSTVVDGVVVGPTRDGCLNMDTDHVRFDLARVEAGVVGVHNLRADIAVAEAGAIHCGGVAGVRFDRQARAAGDQDRVGEPVVDGPAIDHRADPDARTERLNIDIVQMRHRD